MTTEIDGKDTFATVIYHRDSYIQKIDAIKSLISIEGILTEFSANKAVKRMIDEKMTEIAEYKSAMYDEQEIENIAKLKELRDVAKSSGHHGVSMYAQHLSTLITRKFLLLEDKNRCRHGEMWEHYNCCVHGKCCKGKVEKAKGNQELNTSSVSATDEV